MISQLTHVHRATFQLLSSKELKIVGSDLTSGMPILRRIPGLAVDNNFHIPQAYIQGAASAGWTIAGMHESKFSDEAARRAFNESSEIKLGKEYAEKPPFFVMNLQK